MSGTLVYDADCGFCTTCATWMQRRSQMEIVAWQSLDLPTVGLTEAEVTSAAYWLGPDGEKRRGSRAIAMALRSCGRAWPLAGRLIDLPPVRPFAGIGYGLVARYRYKLPGGTDACRLPQA
jgi:predicted DCC family thiol-disulfide oxidoreductase YuxK